MQTKRKNDQYSGITLPNEIPNRNLQEKRAWFRIKMDGVIVEIYNEEFSKMAEN
jgi:hypothetical protein